MALCGEARDGAGGMRRLEERYNTSEKECVRLSSNRGLLAGSRGQRTGNKHVFRCNSLSSVIKNKTWPPQSVVTCTMLAFLACGQRQQMDIVLRG